MKPLTWMRLVRDSDLPPTTRAIAWAIGLRASVDGACYPSYERIAQDTGTHRATAIRHVTALVDACWLMAVPRSNGHGPQANAYQLLDPRLWKTQGKTLWKTQEVVAQDDYLVAQDDPLGSRTGRPRSVRPKEVSETPPTEPVENVPLAAVLNLMAHQSRIPS